MKFVCQLYEKNGTWTAEHTSPNVGPVSVTASTREEALRKLQAEIRYWLEILPVRRADLPTHRYRGRGLIVAGPTDAGGFG
jgi:hypothetical protein